MPRCIDLPSLTFAPRPARGAYARRMNVYAPELNMRKEGDFEKGGTSSIEGELKTFVPHRSPTHN
jgi:hypothetical protein